MNKTNDFKYNLPAYSDPVDIEDLNDNFRGIDDALMAGLCKKDYTGNNMGSSDPSARKYAWAPWLEIVNDNEFDVVVTDRNAPVGSEEATINIAAGQTFRKYINGRYYMNFYVQDQHDVTFKWFTNAETYINESGGGGGGTGTVTSVSVQGGSGSHLTGSGNPIETSGIITINVDEGYSIPSDNEQTAWDGKAADLKFEINSSTFVITAQLKDASGNLIGNERTIDLPLESVVVSGDYDEQTKKVVLTLQNGSTIEFSVADLVSGLQTELSASNKLDPAYIDYDSSHRAVSDTEKDTWSGKQNAISDLETIRSGATAGATAVQPSAMQTALAGKQDSLDQTQLAAVNSGIDSTKVAQISTNQSNILYASKTGAQNIIICSDLQRLKEMNPDSQYVWWEGNVYKSSSWSFTVNGDGSITINGTFPAQTFFYLELSNSDTTRFKNNGIMRLTGCPSGGSENSYFICIRRTTPDYYWFDGGSGIDVNTSESNFITSPIQIFIGIRANVTLSNQTFYPSLVLKTIYEQDSSFHIGALPNYDLTRLEAEDRAALAEEIDAGAKNKFNISGSSFDSFSNQFSVTYSGSSATIKQTGSGTGLRLPGFVTYLDKGTYVLSGCPSGGGQTTYRLDLRTYNGSAGNVINGSMDEGSGSDAFVITTAGNYLITLRLADGYTVPSAGITVTPMICTKAAFGVSNKFVPYRPNWDLVAMGNWSYHSYEYTTTAADTYEYTGISFSVPAHQVYEFIAMDRKVSSSTLGIIVADDNQTVTSPGSVSVIAENSQTFTTPADKVWGRQVHGMTAVHNADNTFYIWVKRASAAKNVIQLAYRRIY